MTQLTTTQQVKVKIPKNNVESDPKYQLYANEPLEALLDYLTKYGPHGISWMGDGWHCRLDLYVNVIGAELKVKSDFDNTSHKNAVIQCIIRLHETIDKINETKLTP
jgi:hypothetical protein